MRWLSALVLFGGAAQADPLGLNDYAALFETHADQLVTDAGGARVLELSDGVTIYETIDGATRLYAGVDFAPGGPVGCLADFYAEVLAFARSCPDLVPAPNPRNLETLMAFYAQNASPVAERAEVEARFEALVETYQSEPAECVPHSAMIDYADVLVGEGADALFEKALAKPRLPVTQPCP
ncbi:hypothetical protein [uncultured Shimia sp.]|uniref:hypothetical protein n=1 Tax=uncultured Shimia sp. TaxID=573152 RepID=UPI0026295468|nr:hypothetical protein [uncultured Shimia sp.]